MLRVGLGLRGKNLTNENMRFAAQLGCTDIVATVFGFHTLPKESPWGRRAPGYRYAYSEPDQWSKESLTRLVQAARTAGVQCRTLENFNPADYYDILLDGPKRDLQIEGLLRMLENAAGSGITHIGFAVNPPGVYGRQPAAGRGGAEELVFDLESLEGSEGLPLGTMWNAVVDPEAPEGILGPISKDEMLDRYQRLMNVLLSAAESLGLVLCLHPQDPPLPSLLGTARIAESVHDFDALFSALPSASHQVLFCTGTFWEMPSTRSVVDAIRHFHSAGRLGYVHIRNVKGKVPHYREVFPDEGDIALLDVIAALWELAYDGVILPDHTPQMGVAEPWHTGMAYAVGFLRGLEKQALRR